MTRSKIKRINREKYLSFIVGAKLLNILPLLMLFDNIFKKLYKNFFRKNVDIP